MPTARQRVVAGQDGPQSATPAPPPITVVLADAHPAMRHSLRLVLDADDGIDVVAEARSLSGAMRHVLATRPVVLVLDLDISDGSSLDVLCLMRDEMPDTRIVVLTMQENARLALAAITAGATGFVLKDAADTELPEAVRRASRDAEFVSPRVAARLSCVRATAVERAARPRVD
jgi:two-component system response regulator NreC